MAGSQDPDENPVAINVVPMVDVIFCLCVFFMCSFKFKQVEGTLDSWLPRDKGSEPAAVEVLGEEVRVALVWEEATATTLRRFGLRSIADDRELERSFRDSREDRERLRLASPLTIDADTRVPWNEVVTVMNLARRAGIRDVGFAYGAPPGLPAAGGR